MATSANCGSLSRASGAAFWPVLFGMLCWHSFAFAHALGLSRGVYRATDDGLSASLVLARAELDRVVPALDRDRNGDFDSGELARASAELERWLLANLEVTSAGARCRGVLERASLTEQDGLGVELRYRCPHPGAAASVSLEFLRRLSQGHRHAATLVSGGVARDEILFGDQRRFEISRAERAVPPDEGVVGLLGFVRMGFEHILTGYDHVVFVLALLLGAARAKSLFWVISAFTLGHSLSLALVVFQVIAAKADVVEPAIALSVAAVGVENLLRARARAADRRWLVTFPFGLIHGLGFASALTEARIPRPELPAALLTFNLGVELGQLALVALFLPFLLWLARAHWFARRAAPALSLAVIVAGLSWFVARVSSGSL